MSGFHDVRLTLPPGLGARGGPERRTEILALASGREQRSTPWAHARRRYDIGGALRSLADAQALVAFFEARRGPLHGFRFRDFLDWRTGGGAVVLPTDEAIGQGDGATRSFQLRRQYGPTDLGYQRPIRKPVVGSVRMAVAGAERPSSDFEVDYGSGLVTFATAPAVGVVVSAGFQFDTPVRFDAERLEISLDGFGAARAATIPLVEILDDA